MSERFRYNEDFSWGNKRHILHGGKGAHLTTYRDKTVQEGAPELAAFVGQWVSHRWAGRKEEILICDRVTLINGMPYVIVQRRPPWTGGCVPVAHVVDALPKPCTALGFPICTAIVVYKEKAAG